MIDRGDLRVLTFPDNYMFVKDVEFRRHIELFISDMNEKKGSEKGGFVILQLVVGLNTIAVLGKNGDGKVELMRRCNGQSMKAASKTEIMSGFDAMEAMSCSESGCLVAVIGTFSHDILFIVV